MSEPTICAECKYCCVTNKYTCLWPQKDLVTGDYGPKSCQGLNDGKCDHYEDANWVVKLKGEKQTFSVATASRVAEALNKCRMEKNRPKKEFLLVAMAKISAATQEDAEDHLYTTLRTAGDIKFSINSYAITAENGNQLRFKKIDLASPLTPERRRK